MLLRLATIEAFLPGARAEILREVLTGKPSDYLKIKSPRLHDDTHSLPKGKTMIKGTAAPNISNELRILASFDQMNQTLDEIKNVMQNLLDLAVKREDRADKTDGTIDGLMSLFTDAMKVIFPKVADAPAPPPPAPADAPPPDAPVDAPPPAPVDAPPPDAPVDAPPPDAPVDAPPPDAPAAPRGRSPESY